MYRYKLQTKRYKILFCIVLILFLIAVLIKKSIFFFDLKNHYDEKEMFDIIKLFNEIEKEFSLPQGILFSIALVESNLRFNAIADNGCSRGIFQINYCVHTDAPERNLIAESVWVAKKIKEYYDKYQDINLAITKYNCYSCNYKTRYAAKVIHHLNKIQNEK